MTEQKQLQNVKYFKSLGSMMINDAIYTCEIKFRINMAKAAFNRKKTLFTSKVYFNFRKKVVMCYILNIALYGAKTWTLWKEDQKDLKTFSNVVLEKDGEY